MSVIKLNFVTKFAMSDQEDEGMETDESQFRMILSLTFQNGK